MSCCGNDILIQGGDGIRVEGSGSPSNPYIVMTDLPDFREILEVRDTSSVNLRLQGSGSAADPFILSANTTVKITDLIDILDPEGGPADGETLVRVGTGADGHWEYKTPPAAPAGTVNVSDGITGAGTIQNPLRARVSGTWGVAPLDVYGNNPAVGGLIYLDASGNLRAQPATAGGGTADSVSWNNVTGKPTAFPPEQHTHLAADIVLAEQRKLDVGKVNGSRWTSSATAPTGAIAGDVWVRRV